MPRRILLPLVVTIGLGACVFPYEMERAGPPGSGCAVQTMPAARDAPADTTRLRWYRPREGRDQRIDGETCAELDGPLFSGIPTGTFAEWRTGDSLVVMSWNMDEGDGSLRSLLEGETGARCRDGGSSVAPGAPLFVLLVQRAVRSNGDADILQTARSCGLAYHYVASAPVGGHARDRGNAILSTLPMTAPIALSLPAEGTRRVAVAATVLLPGGERMRVVSADVDGSSSLFRTLVGGNQVRARQARGLVDGLDAADDDGPLNAATLLGGDFSTWHPTETAMRDLRDAFGESPAWDGLRTRGLFAPDHIFFRRGSFRTITVGRYARVEDRYGSSHHPRRVVVNYLPIG